MIIRSGKIINIDVGEKVRVADNFEHHLRDHESYADEFEIMKNTWKYLGREGEVLEIFVASSGTLKGMKYSYSALGADSNTAIFNWYKINLGNDKTVMIPDTYLETIRLSNPSADELRLWEDNYRLEELMTMGEWFFVDDGRELY